MARVEADIDAHAVGGLPGQHQMADFGGDQFFPDQLQHGHELAEYENLMPLVAKLGYAVGFLVVILGSQQLFTENTLEPVIPLLHRRDRRTLLARVGRAVRGTAMAALVVHRSASPGSMAWCRSA